MMAPRFLCALWLLTSAPPTPALPVNFAPAGTSTGSSESFGSIFRDANDGIRDGNFNSADGSVWHTALPDTGAFYEVDLGSEVVLDRVMIWPRTDILQGTVRNFSIKVLSATDAVVWSADYWPTGAANQPWGTSELRGQVGRKVRFEKRDATPNFLTFAEFEVWGSAGKAATNLARDPGVTVTASPAGFGTTAAAAVDGQLNGDYTSVASPRPIYASSETSPGVFWQLDFGVAREIDYLTIYNRSDALRTTDAKIALLDADHVEVHSATVNLSRDVLVNQGRQFDVTYDVPATLRARYVRISTVAATALALAEVEVFGPTEDIYPPTVARRDPDAGAVIAELTRIEVDFSEPVVGVNAAALQINGEPATSVTAGDPSRYSFTCAQPANGPVLITFAPDHGIADAVGNAFAGASWSVSVDNRLPPARPIISEIMADNRGGWSDADGDTPDWIELYNPGPLAVNLGGWFLSDTPTALSKWSLPNPTLLPAGQYLIVFASSKDRRIAGRELHTNFKLDPDGDSVLLTHPDGVTVVSRIDSYPPQRSNVSFGRASSYVSTPLIEAGRVARWMIPTSDVPGWTTAAFDDDGWMAGTLGVGFDDSSGGGPGGPLGWWNFDTATDASKALDASGNGRGGTVVNALYSGDAQGRSGQAGDRSMVFAGNGAVWIPAAATGAFDSITAHNAMTVSLWIYGAADMPRDHYTFYGAADTGFGTRVTDVHLPWSDQSIYWDTAGCCDPGQTRISIGEPNPAMWKGRWNHYAFVKNGDMKEIWQNGFLLHSGINTAPMTNLRSFAIGAANNTGTLGYSGRIDDFALWDTALTETQITSLAAGASPLGLQRLTPLIATDLTAPMKGGNASAFVRIPFAVADASAIDLLTLRMRYDDGFVAFLNGVEVARTNAPSVLTAASAAPVERPGGAALIAEEFDLSRFAPLLHTGTNVLALHGLNHSPDDPDFLLLPELRAGQTSAARYFSTATPGAANGVGYTGFVSDVRFSPQRGYYDAPMEVTLTCATPGATVVWTTDGSTPSATHGATGSSPVTVPIAGTTSLRATAILGTLAPTNVDTHSYLFADQVAGQRKPASAPAAWPGGAAADFVMDPRVPGPNPPPTHTLRAALVDIPTLSLTADPADLWGSQGIYANPGGRGGAWERATSVEWIDPLRGEEAHATGGLRIHGNITRDKGFTPKHSFTLRFKSVYGDTKFRHPVFPDTSVDAFDEFVLRAGSTDTWPGVEWGAVGLGLNGQNYQRWNRDWASYVRDQWVRDTHLAMGHEDFRGRFCQLYLNGLYWGLYNITESPSAGFMASHLGGREVEWDTMADFSELHDGTRAAWDELLGLADGGQLSSDAGLRRVQGLNPDGTPNPAFPRLLEVDSLIDYMILHIYIGADDWPDHNWWGARPTRAPTPEGFRFFAWDQEISNENSLYGRSSWGVVYAEANANGTPTRVYSRLRSSPEFRLRFADRIQKHLFNTGALTQTANMARWQRRVDEIDRAIVAESARWGDAQPNHTRPGQPYTRSNGWLPHLAWMGTNYWPQIPGVALQRYKSANLYPAIPAPTFSRFGGVVPPTFDVTVAIPNAAAGQSIVYTTDGTDPRRWGGTQNPAAVTAAGASVVVPLTANSTLKARVKNGTTWSALTESTFALDGDLDDDGIADEWEAAHGLSATDPADAMLDPDQDGRSNAEEYAAGTDPHNSASQIDRLLDVTPDPSAPGAVTLAFPLEPGRTYSVQRSTSLTRDTWVTRTTIGPESSPRLVTWGESPAAPWNFYRLVIVPPMLPP